MSMDDVFNIKSEPKKKGKKKFINIGYGSVPVETGILDDVK
jgi:hypothetical protein